MRLVASLSVFSVIFVAAPTGAGAATAKVQICHLDQTVGSYSLISVRGSKKTIKAHLGHGDGYPGEPVPGVSGYEFDNQCSVLPSDTDGDGLTDLDEVNVYGTDPLLADTDGDSLGDGWEVQGHPNGTVLPGADPLRADIYVEMDYMVRDTAVNGLGPNSAVLAEIVKTFANAPRLNPDGSRGIDIHLDLDDEVALDTQLYPVETDFDAIKDANFDADRQPMYHYMIWADRYNFGSSRGCRSGSTRLISSSPWGLGTAARGGTDDQKIGTFIHELGHNLNLRHGGGDNENYKPNYISVMSYAFQVVGVNGPNGPVFDYQRFDLPDLDETVLDEVAGLGLGPHGQAMARRTSVETTSRTRRAS